MKVLAVSSYGVLGGAELSMLATLDHRPADVHPTALLLDDGPLRAQLAERGIPVAVASGYVGKPTPARTARFGRSLARLLERERPDVVWAIGLKAAFLAAAACRARNAPIVWHRVDFAYDGSLTKPVAACVHGVVTVSEALADSLGALRRARFLGVAPPPVTLPDGLAASPRSDGPVIGTLARLTPYKGLHHMIRAMALLAPEFPGLRLVLAGAPVREDADYPAALRTLAEELGVSDRVEIPGFIAPESLLERLTVFLNATYLDEEGYGLEGLGIAMIEASWAGVPVVATRGGGAAEAVADGITGTLVDEPEPEALAEAARAYLSDPELAASTGAAGRRFAREGFAPGPAAKRLFDLLAAAA